MNLLKIIVEYPGVSTNDPHVFEYQRYAGFTVLPGCHMVDKKHLFRFAVDILSLLEVKIRVV